MKIFALIASGVALHLIAQTPPAEFARAVQPFIQKNCQSCHNTNLPSGSVDLQQMLAAPNSLAEQHDTWMNIAYVLRSGQMPPKAAPQPSKTDRDTALELISRAIAASPRSQTPLSSRRSPRPRRPATG